MVGARADVVQVSICPVSDGVHTVVIQVMVGIWNSRTESSL